MTDSILRGTILQDTLTIKKEMLRYFPNDKIQTEIENLEKYILEDIEGIELLTDRINKSNDYINENSEFANQYISEIPLQPPSESEKIWASLAFQFDIQRYQRRINEREWEIRNREHILLVREAIKEHQEYIKHQEYNFLLCRTRQHFYIQRLQQISNEAAFEFKADGVFWGGVWYPWKMAAEGLFVVGAQNTGKTLIIKSLMASTLPLIGKRRNHRALIYDYKRDIYPYLLKIGVPENRIKILNPIDKRSVGWAIWKDVKKASLAIEIGYILIPPDKVEGNNSYFKRAARSFLINVMKAFITLSRESEKQTGKPIEWTLADVHKAMRNVNSLRSILSKTKETEEDTRAFFEPEKTFKNVWGEVRTHLEKLEVVAALWDNVTEYISLSEWAKDNNYDENILIIGSDPEYETTIGAINRVLLQRISEILRKQSKDEVNPRVTWLYLDEFPQIGRIEKFDDVLSVGRDKGICPVIGLQDPAQLQREDRYNKEEADVILNLSKNKIYLGVEGASVREWCAAQFGDVEKVKHLSNFSESISLHLGRSESISNSISSHWSTTTGQSPSSTVGGGSSTTETLASSFGVGVGFGEGNTEQRPIEKLILPSEFAAVDVEKIGSVIGYARSPFYGAYPINIPLDPVKRHLPKENNKHLDYIERDDADEERLREWTSEDLIRLFGNSTEPPNTISQSVLELPKATSPPKSKVDVTLLKNLNEEIRLRRKKKINFGRENGFNKIGPELN